MIIRALPVALAALAAPALGQSCEPTGQSDNCVRVLACIGERGLWFDGRAIGWNEGVIAGEMSDGSICTGHWWYDGPISVETRVSCDDGMRVMVRAIAQDPRTGTTIGEGWTEDGRRVTSWSGGYVMDFLRDAEGVPSLPCTDAPIPIG